MNNMNIKSIFRFFPKETSYCFVLFFLFSFLTLSIIPIYRIQHFEGWPSGELIYSHMQNGHYLLSHAFPEYTPYILLQTPFRIDPFDILFSFAEILLSQKITALFLPLFLGLLTLFFLYKILELFFPSPKQQLIAGLFCLANPIFLTLFTEASNLTFIAFCTAAASYFFIQKDKSQYLAPIFLFLLLFYNAAHMLLSILLIFVLGRMTSKIRYGNILSFIFLFSLIIQFFFRSNAFQPNTFQFIWSTYLFILQQSLSDLGGKFGVSIFSVFIAIFGFHTFCSEKKNCAWFSSLCFIFAALFFTFFSSAYYALYLILPLSILSTAGFFSLLKRSWKIENLRNLTVFLLILGIIFSATSTLSRIASADPTPEMIEGLLWLKQNSYENAIILTSERYANVVSYTTQRRIIFDKTAAAAPENSVIVEEVHRLLHTRELDIALPLLEHFQIDYVVVFADMKSGGVWDSNQQGLLFLLQNGENFKKIFENEAVEIWSVYY